MFKILDSGLWGSFAFAFINIYAFVEKMQAGLANFAPNDINLWLGTVATLVGVVGLIIKTYFNYKDRELEIRIKEEELKHDTEKNTLERESIRLNLKDK